MKNNPTPFIVRESASLISFLSSVFPGKPRTAIKQLLKNGCILVNQKPVFRFDEQLIPGQQVQILKTGVSKITEETGIKILYEDDSIIVISKPEGLLTIATGAEKSLTAYSFLSKHVKTRNASAKIFIVHRLDRETSGVMVFARNQSAKETMQEAWHNDQHRREYMALVSGHINEPEGTIESWLKENANFQVYSTNDRNNGKHAITHYKLIRQNETHSLLKVIPETGRKNQIRVHLSDIGYPIVGDKRYGNGDRCIGRLGLHAGLLAFNHPVTGNELVFEVPAPSSFLKTVAKKQL